MKKPGKNIKAAVKGIGFLAGGILIFILMGAAIHNENTQPISGFEVNSGNKGGNNFIDDSDIYTILKNSQYLSKEGAAVQNADLERLSILLNNNPYIKQASVYVGADGKVMIKVRQRTAILRVINTDGVSFYLDENGDKMPASDKFTPRVEVASGAILDKGLPNDTTGWYITGKLYYLTKKIEANAFMNALVQQIYVDENKELELIPEVGNFSILIGDTDRLNEKFTDLQSLYHAHSDDFPWNVYQTLSLKYAHQVIGIKNGNAVTSTPIVADVNAQKGNEKTKVPDVKLSSAVKEKSDSLKLAKTEKKKEEKTEKKEKHDKKKKHKKDSQ